jgi:hypothetical protein
MQKAKDSDYGWGTLCTGMKIEKNAACWNHFKKVEGMREKDGEGDLNQGTL